MKQLFAQQCGKLLSLMRKCVAQRCHRGELVGKGGMNFLSGLYEKLIAHCTDATLSGVKTREVFRCDKDFPSLLVSRDFAH
jgi:hypothetical protein